LQHQDGNSHLLFSCVPNCRAYDPAFAYELATILERGMQEMLVEQHDRFYYITVTNARYPQPSLPPGEQVRKGILRGLYCLYDSRDAQLQLLGSGALMTEVLSARELLKRDWGITAAVWSVTSYVELHRDGIDSERRARLHPDQESVKPFVTEALTATRGPIVAVTDYVRALPELIRAFVPRRYITLGTDGFGRSDCRASLRSFFEVDAGAIVVASLEALAAEGEIERARVADAVRNYFPNPDTPSPWTR
jgi:pyruvate dehydrogenase E1 component